MWNDGEKGRKNGRKKSNECWKSEGCLVGWSKWSMMKYDSCEVHTPFSQIQKIQKTSFTI